MRRVHHWRAPRWLRIWMVSATRLGDGWIWYSVGIALLLFGGDLRFIAFAASASAEAAAVALFRIVKNTSKRKRPCQLEAHCWSKVLPPYQFSFPSGHSMRRVCHRHSLVHFLPGIAGSIAGAVAEHRCFARHPWDALRQRCGGGVVARDRAGVRVVPAVPVNSIVMRDALLHGRNGAEMRGTENGFIGKRVYQESFDPLVQMPIQFPMQMPMQLQMQMPVQMIVRR